MSFLAIKFIKIEKTLADINYVFTWREDFNYNAVFKTSFDE